MCFRYFESVLVINDGEVDRLTWLVIFYTFLGSIGDCNQTGFIVGIYKNNKKDIREKKQNYKFLFFMNF